MVRFPANRLAPRLHSRPSRQFGWVPFVAGAVVSLLLAGMMSADAAAESPQADIPSSTTAPVTRVTTPPLIDGKLDDPCWQTATIISNFTQVRPREGEPPTERTTVQFAIDHRHLYVAIRCYDSQPNLITARELQRDSIDGDSPFTSDDHVMLVLDPFHRERDGYLFAVNPLGAQADGRIEQGSYTYPEWDGLWDARGAIDEHGWTAELIIPFSSLSFNPANEDWGMNLQRIIRRKDEVVRWASAARSRQGDSLAGIGQLTGLENLHQGHGWEFKPYVSLQRRDRPSTGERYNLRSGLDLSYLITPAVSAAVTLNTDFAETEVDSREVNLTRFPLFFPEKRSFFLRDSPYFAWTGSGTPYYSRRIGIGNDGQPIDILGGAKITGRHRGLTFGLLDVQQESHAGNPSKHLFVGRVTQEIFGESTLGLIGTHGDPVTNGDNSLLGLDFKFLRSELPSGNQISSHAWIMHTDSDRAGGDGRSFGANVIWPNIPWSFFNQFSQVDGRFDPGLGFAERTAIRRYSGNYGYQWIVNRWGLQRIDVFVSPLLITDLDDRVETENHRVPRLLFINDAGDSIHALLKLQREQLFDVFEIRPGVVIPAADYRGEQLEVGFEGSPSRQLAPRFEYEAGGFYDGHSREYEAGLDWRPSKHVLLGGGFELNEIRLPYGSFNARLANLRLNLALNPRLSWNNLAQYDNESDDLGIHSRIRWTVRPGTDVYLVWNQGYQMTTSDRWRRTLTDTVIKGGLTWRF